jgi:hypothetical protein
MMVRKAVHKEEIRKQLITTNNMNYTPDWTVIGKARNQTAHMQTFVTKLLYNWLPTNSKMHQQLSSHNETCPYCNQAPETTPHALTCPAHTIIPKIAKETTENLTQLPPEQLEEILTTTRANPELISKGLLPKTWEDSGDNPWKTRMTREIWQLAHTHWLERCEKCLEQPETNVTAVIQELYQEKEQLSQRDQDNIYVDTLPKILTAKRTHQQQWVQTFTTVIKHTKQQQAAKMRATANTMIFEPAGEQVVDSNQPSRGSK